MADKQIVELTVDAAPVGSDVVETQKAGGGAGSSRSVLLSNLAKGLTLQPASAANSVLANMAQNTFKGRISTGAGSPEDLSATQARTLLNVEDGASADQSGAEIETAYNSQVAQVSAGEKTAGTEVAVRRFSPSDVKDMTLAHAPAGGGGLVAADIDTLAELNAIVTDATLIDTGDARLSDARTPTSHSASHTDGTDDIQSATAGQKGLMTAAQVTKLDAIEASATADQTGAEIKVAYEAEADTNAFTDAEQSKLGAIEASATADQSAAEVPFTPAGNLAATDVQAALAELDTEKEAAGAVATHEGAGDPHPQYLTSAEGDAAYAAIAHASSTANPHSVTQTQVGLANVDNTSDANKPVSTAQQTALDAVAWKQPFAGITGTVAYARASHVGRILRTSGATPILNATSEAQIQSTDWFAVRQTDGNAPTVNLPAGATANGTPSWGTNAVVYYHCVGATGGAYVFDLMGSLA